MASSASSTSRVNSSHASEKLRDRVARYSYCFRPINTATLSPPYQLDELTRFRLPNEQPPPRFCDRLLLWHQTPQVQHNMHFRRRDRQRDGCSRPGCAGAPYGQVGRSCEERCESLKSTVAFEKRISAAAATADAPIRAAHRFTPAAHGFRRAAHRFIRGVHGFIREVHRFIRGVPRYVGGTGEKFLDAVEKILDDDVFLREGVSVQSRRRAVESRWRTVQSRPRAVLSRRPPVESRSASTSIPTLRG